MTEIGIGTIGGGYMGKAHAVTMSAVGAVFETRNLKGAAQPDHAAFCQRQGHGTG